MATTTRSRGNKAPGDTPRVRVCRPADLDGLIEVFTGAVRIVARRDYSADQVRAWAPDHIDRAAWAARCASRPTWVAEINGAIAGFADLEPDGHIDMFYVHAEHQRQGVGTALLTRIESEAAARLPRLFVEASLTALPFFRHHGFALVARQQVMRRGQTFVNCRMEKML